MCDVSAGQDPLEGQFGGIVSPAGRPQPGGISQVPIYSAGRRPEWNFQTVSKVLGLSLTHILLCVSIHIRI